MKREEALEYMNRYLDHDLTKEETDTLFRHLGESPEAREDFEFLQGLSDQLESLPDVKPPVSLVDSILPKLDEIDRLAAIAAPEAQPEKLSEMESKRMLGEEVPKRRRAAAFWRSTLGRTVGGTAVAAAVLGIFVVNYEPKEMPNAEVSSSAAVTGATDDTLVPSGGAQTESATTDPSTEVESAQPEAQLEPSENKLRQNEGQTEPEETPPASEDGAAADQPTSDSSNDAGEPAAGSQPTDGGNTHATEPNSGTSSNDEQSGDKSQQPATPKSNASPNTDGTARKNPGTSDSSQPSTNQQDEKAPTVDATPPASPPAQSGEAEGGAADEEGEPNEGINTFSLGDEPPATDRESSTGPNDASDAMENQIYSLAIVPLEWTSPDGTYLITYSSNTLELLKGDRSKKLNTYKVDGEVTGGIWSADGKTFTYDLLKPDGTVAQGTWKIEEVTLEQGGK